MFTAALGPGARVAFAGRADGTSRPPYDRGNLAVHVGDAPDDVAANRAMLAAAAGADSDRLVAMSARHGNEVALVSAADSGREPAVDVMVSTDPGCALLVLAADCVPVLLADGAAGVVGVVHAGWRGVRADATGAGLRAMAELGATRITALVGPAICGSCYAVDQERYDDVVAVAPEAAARAGGGGPGLDLRAAVLARLERAGVELQVLGRCTNEEPEWFSYRRDGITGRHGGAVVLEPAGATR